MKSKLFVLLMLSLPATTCFAQSPYQYRERGLTIGALMGALTGTAIGDHNDNALAGAAIGTAVGALAGAAIGDTVDTDLAHQNAIRQEYQNQQLAGAVSIDDVISMSQSGLSDQVIATHIRTQGVINRLQATDLIVLSRAGVSDTVIQAMQTARLATATPVIAAPPPGYRDRVIVERHHYVRPSLPPPSWLYWSHPGQHHHRHHAPGVHWGISVGR